MATYRLRCVMALLWCAGVAWGEGAAPAFTFTITADSHLDENTDRALYQRTLDSAAADKPVFHVDLGDTFMTEKLANRADSAGQYVEQRRYFDALRVPVYLVSGNHDGESGRYLDGTADNLAVWSRMMRWRYFPNPATDGTRNYYAWEQGDALLVALDPFWYTPRQRREDDNWTRTLGAGQYEWLQRTLAASRAKFKFVFIHHLVGGLDRQARGGVEAARYFEWGGRNADGTDGFGTRRPGWALPIHQLLAQNHVSIVFHGHDHLYARQELDGVIYQEVPQPGDPRGNMRNAADYGYWRGVMLPSSGYLRVRVSADSARVEYVRPDRSMAATYSVQPREEP